MGVKLFFIQRFLVPLGVWKLKTSRLIDGLMNTLFNLQEKFAAARRDTKLCPNFCLSVLFSFVVIKLQRQNRKWCGKRQGGKSWKWDVLTLAALAPPSPPFPGCLRAIKASGSLGVCSLCRSPPWLHSADVSGVQMVFQQLASANYPRQRRVKLAAAAWSLAVFLHYK